ncbi:MAG: hypothetical protein J6Q95_01455 [Alistipes sp.]|nr:hypothetical protein [Alistipes sp.]
MRKIFSTLKSVVAVALVAAMTLSVSCSYDDTGIKKDIKNIQQELAALTERVAALETKLASEVESLEALIDGKVVVVDIIENEDGSKIIKLSDGEEVTVFPACDHECVPCDHECTPCEHECTPCECDPLQYRVVDGVLEVSADGVNWIAVNGVAAEQVVADVVVNEDGTVTITLATGEEINVGAKAELIEFEAARGQVYVIAGQTKEVAFAINDAVAEINVMNQPFGWSAEVAAAEAETPESGDDAGIMPLAAGGQNFVLKINGPSQELVNAGYAAKEGLVSVHFNTADGACKVANVAVNLAEITLAVDNAGNITITNTMATEQENYWGEKFVDFADFFIGIMPKSLYDEHGKDALRNDFQDWDFETAAATQRSTGLWNVADLKTYEEGVYEEEIIEITVDKLASAFYPVYNFEVGKEYIIFISLESELKNYYEIPVLDNAIMANYKSVLVEAEYVADSATWNDATLHVSLAGYQNYLIGWMPVAEANDYIANGMASSIEELLPLYINGYGLMSSGAIIAGDYIDQDIKLSELAELSLMGWAPEVAANTEYHLYVYPFNAETEMEFYQHQMVAENLRYIGTFSTTALVAGDFAVDATYEVVEHVEDNIEVNVTVAENLSVYYTWFDQSYADPEEAAYLVLGDVYTEKVEGEASFTAEKFGYYGLPNPIYLAMVAINESGEYVYVEQEFKYIEPEPVALVSFEYQGRHLDIDDNEETSGGDHVYIATAEDGTVYTIGLYWQFADENGVITEGEYDYCTNYFDAMYSYWNGFVIVADEQYSGSSLTVTADTITLKVKGVGKYVYDRTAQGGGDEPEPEPTPAYNFVRAKQTGTLNDAKIQIYSENDEYCLVLNMYGIISGDKYIPEGTYQFGNNYGQVYCYNYSYLYDYSVSAKTFFFQAGYGEVKVSEVDGKYRIEIIDAMGTADNAGEGELIPFSAVYEGTIENLILPSEYVAPVQIEFTPVRAEYDLMFDLYEYNGGDAEYAFWLYDENNNYLEVICKFGPHTGWDYEYSAKYVGTDGEMVFASIQTQAPSSYNCSSDAEKYFSVKATMTDNSYIMFYDVLPAVAVNYLGEGSNYAPGSENQGGNEGGNEGGDEPVVPGEVTELTIVSHAFGYTGAAETEVIFREATPGVEHIVDFRMTGIEAGTYNDSDNGIILGYCRYMYGSSDYGGGVVFDSANATITDNGDTTFTFDVNFVADGAAYHFTYTTPAQEVEESGNTVELISKSAGEKIGSYAFGCLLSDAEGNNQVKIAVDEYYSWDANTDFPKANAYTTWQSSPSFMTQASHFSFVNKTLKVNGVTYDNDAVSNAKLTVVEATSITIEFTVDGEDYKFVYSAF